jgi:hypothetical protein
MADTIFLSCTFARMCEKTDALKDTLKEFQNKQIALQQPCNVPQRQLANDGIETLRNKSARTTKFRASKS